MDCANVYTSFAETAMYPVDIVKNYAFMCDKKTNPESLARFESEVIKKTNVIATFSNVKAAGAQSSTTNNSVDDY